MASRRRDTVARLCAVAAVVLLSVCVSVVALDPPPPYAPVNPGGPAPAYPNAKTITICASGCDYTQPRLAFPIAGGNRLAAGDTLEIRPGTYNDPIMSCMYIVFDDLNVVGVLDSNGNRPKLSGLCGGKAAVVTGAKRIKVSNLELAGVSCSDGNCAGVRHDAAGGEVTLTNLWIHDNQNGLLASAKDDVITIVDCLFENNGFDSSQGMAHNLYIGNSAAVYFRNSISRRAKLGGHEFKSRAYYTEIESSIIGSMDGVDSRNIDICDGGTLVLRNSIIQKGANSMNTDMINYAAENWNQAGTYVRKNAIFMSNNIGISDRSKSTFLLIMQNRNPSSHEIIGHTLVNLEKLYDGSTSLLVTGTLLKSSRAAAGYPAYPALPPVPEPGSAGVPPSDNSGPKAPTSPTAVLVTPPSPPVATNPGAPAPAYPNAKKVTVCASGCQYTSLYSAHQAAVAGDTIEVSGPGPYGCLSIEKDDITLTGVLNANGVRPKLTTTCGRKGVLVTIGKRITIKNLELYGAECSDGNCAGIRHDAAGGGLTLINVWSHDNQNGILASARDDIVTIQDCLFESNGFDDGRGMAHNLYMNKHAAVYFRNSISRLARLGGHELKSRAYYTEVESSYLVSLDGVDSRMVDAPEGGIVVIRNSVLASGARTQNQDMVGWAPENFDTRTHEFYAQNNIVISDRAGSPIFLQVYQARFPTKWQIANNKFVKIGTIISDGGAGQMKDVGSWVYLNREAANYGAYPYYPPLPTATPTGPATYSWKQSGFSACTVTCGGGTQTQTVTCVQDGTTTSVAESYCSGTKPATQQTCGTGACPATYSWKQGGFGACTATCGGGTQTQSVTCVRDGTTTVVADSNCSGTKPLTVQSCNMKACPATYSWKQSGFSACTVTCGGGMQTQTVTCVQDGTTTSVADTYCANSGAKPATQQTCSTQACSAPATFSWKQSGFGACTVTCGSGTQTQTVSCVRDGSTTAVADSFCSGTKPATQQSCNPGACPAYSWKQGGFGVCTQTCGGGTQTQSVTCVQDGTKTVADTLCTGTKPLTVQSCNIQACPVTYSWQQSGFSVCTVTCGGGTQTQTVTCVQDGTTKSVAETNCANSGTKPATQQTCNTQSCTAPVTFSWKQNGFGACTVTCGGGTQTQTVTCVRDSSTTMVADTNCDAASKPATQQSCNTQACSTPATFSWVAGGYTACTVTCGGGTQSQKVTCMQDGTKTAVDESNCAASTKPRTLLPCSTQSCPLPSDSSTGPSGPVKPLPVGPAQRLTIKVARDLTTDVAHSTYTSEFIVQTSSILGIPQRRVQVVSLKPGSTVVEFLILPPYSDETGESASVSAEEAAKLFIDDWTKEESTLRAQSSMADGEASQGLQANVVTQCGDMSYDCGRDASSVDGNGGGSKSVTSESWFIAVVVILVIAVVGVVSFGVFKYHSKKSASLKTLSTASMYGITTDSHSGGDVQMQSQSQSAPMPTGQVQPISQPAEVLFAARPPPPVPSNRPPPMPRREVPIGLA